jgi:hypothetical protein
MALEIDTDKKNDFLNEFLEIYNQGGFGSLNKKEFELLLFHLLRKYGNLKDKDFYRMSLELKIPESRIRTLAYEADLKFGDTADDSLRDAFGEKLKKVKIDSINGKITFSIPDKTLRTYLHSVLNNEGDFADTSFNRDIVSLSIDSFTLLLDKLFWTNEFIEEVLKVANGKLEKSDFTAKRLVSEFLFGIAKQAGKTTFDVSLFIATGGAAPAITLANKILDVVK